MTVVPPESEREPAEWLRYAAEDLAIAGWLLDAPKPFTRGALFHCQQTVEKLLKGFLLLRGRSFRKTHDLAALGEECLEIDPQLSDDLRASYGLTEFASRARYPGDWDEPGTEEARALYRTAERVLAAMSSRILRDTT